MYNDGVNPLMIIHQTSATGKVLFAGYAGAQPTTTPNGFALNCILVDEVNKLTYVNIGTTTVPVWELSTGRGVQIQAATIATTSTSDSYIMAPCNGSLQDFSVSALVALATSDTNYITFTVTNLGQAGAGTTAMLSTSDLNSTKATGGQAIVLNGKTALTVSAVSGACLVAKGDRIRIRATATGTLANTVTAPVYLATFAGTSV